MTVSHRKTKVAAKTDDRTAAEPGVQYHCDICEADITLTVRIRCAGGCKDFDLCGSCFCSGAESKQHKAWHDYRIVEQHAYPIFSEDWGADEELLLIDGCQTYGLGNWADIADHIGNRSKEEVEAHYISVFVEGRDGTAQGDARASQIVQEAQADPSWTSRQWPVAGPHMAFTSSVSPDEFQRRKRRRISDLRSHQASLPIGAAKSGVPPKPLVSAPTSHHELSGFMAGRLEFETEHEQEAETLTKDMEFGKVYAFGGELLPSEEEALGGKAVGGRSRMEASGRGGPSSSRKAGATGSKGAGSAAEETEGGNGEPAKDEETQQQDKADNGDEEDEEDGEVTKDPDATKDADETMADATIDPEDEDGDGDTQPLAKHSAAKAAKESRASGKSKAQSKGKDASEQGSTSTAPPAATTDTATTESSERPPADWDEDPTDLELKLMILEMYNERLERRTDRKSAVLERGLVEVRRRQAAEKRRPKEARDLLNRVRHFTQLQTAMDFEEFFDGLCYQESLRRLALQLQEYRRFGLTTLSEASRYEAEKAERLRKAALLAEDYAANTSGTLVGGPQALLSGKRGPSTVRKGGRDSETPFGEDEGSVYLSVPPASVSGAAASSAKREKGTEPKSPRKPPRPLDLSSHPSLNLLTRPEQECCSVNRIQPSAFLVMKKEILTEYIRRKGKMSRRETRTLFKMDVNKVGKVFDLLDEQGYLSAAKSIGWAGGKEGEGVPPGWKDPTGANGLSVNGGGGGGDGPSVNGSSSGPGRPGSPAPNQRLAPPSAPGSPSVRGSSTGPQAGRGGIGPSPLSQQAHGDNRNHSPFRPTATA
ncbi:hypothetical protein BCV69DRAFT_297779 [Microstroma glucosiphilum]|uniref:Transcriptional adapter 2 n=1 Tax=Pseudomicrostroma glucosiphilum TaxID=1684307 RepID=A0A316UDS3_9BASI|nr:hypothetical protein BCV69DRAFT_297779 [Pseudomicrostroma glucosiphilum]PWN22491.1 hypothetical protein BCV69DRAFT_297779 [Pseudomicrostroma glucosiphilum]